MIQPLPSGRARLIGPYQLLGLLGAGGMGEVYLARPAGAADPRAGLVALKTVRPDLDLDDGFRVRFRREIGAAGAVRSPHTAALVGGDADARLPWLATEYVPGPSLAEAVTRCGPLPEHIVRELGAGLARALADMHAVRVLHRDLKPGNVLLGPDGPKVIDFGIAQAFDATQLTRTGVVVGSPGYISPEHVNGSRSLVPASDVFCLGAVLAFAAAGRGPFDDSDMAAVVFRISRGEAELSGVPPRLREVVRQCLHRAAEARPTPERLAALLLPDGPPSAAGPGPFPWPDAVRGLLAAHAAGARAADEATAPQAAAPPAPFRAPEHAPAYVPGPGEGAPAPTPAVPAAAPGEGGRRGRARWIGAAAAVAVCATLGAVFLPGLLDGGDGGGASAGAGRPADSASASPSGAAGAGAVVVPGADPGRTGDFGAAAAALATRPAGWQAWRTRIEDGPAECVLADATLVCGGPRRVTALDATNGKQRWQAPPGRTGAGPASVAAVVGATVYAFEDGALVARDLADGTERRREPFLAGARVVDSVASGRVLYYVTRTGAGADTAGTGRSRVVARELSAAHPVIWDTAQDGPAGATALALADGRLVVAGDGVTVLNAADGRRLASVPAGEISCRMPVLKGKRLLCAGPLGLSVMDVTAPGDRRWVAEGLDVAFPPVLSRDGKVVVSSRTTTYAFGLSDGRQYWATKYGGTDGLETMGRPSLVGDRLLVVGKQSVAVADLATEGYPDWNGNPPAGWPQRGTRLDPASISLVARGNVAFLSFKDGTVLSYAP
ncbi:protein kinase domain-containing protein [Streptomyces sp. PTD5-9]|uniref:serine/threonine-protein kinase n=1 Tax=Streptomyces sp. PTD5-9 TaxID=3120150 RepID=UPI003009E049